MSPDVLNALLVAAPLVSIVAAAGFYWRYRSQRGVRFLFLLPLLICLAIMVVVGNSVEALLNRVSDGEPGPVSDRARALHESSRVVDLHADPLMFGRDLLQRSSTGHVDLPRLIEGGTALQVFSLVTRIPLGYNEVASDPDGLDLVTLLGIVHLWPPSTYFDLHERVLHHARRLEEMAARSDGRLRMIRDRRDLTRLMEARGQGEKVVGGLFALEGAYVFGSDFRAQLDDLFEHGLRMVSLTHFTDNDFAGSVQGLHKGGLTEKGHELIGELERRGIVVDLAHASYPTIDDVLAVATQPVVFSHTGVAGTCDQYHNLTDRHVRAIAANGGVIGVGLWDTAVCGTTAADTVRAMKHVIDLVGDTHVALGSDFDGYVVAHFDTSHLPLVTQAMLDAGLEEETIRRILGGNAIRVLQAALR